MRLAVVFTALSIWACGDDGNATAVVESSEPNEPSEPSEPSEPNEPSVETPTDLLAPVLQLRNAHGEPLLFLPIEELLEEPRLEQVAQRLEQVALAETSEPTVRRRVSLQNDAWGVVARIAAHPMNEPRLERLGRAATHLAWRSALDPNELDAVTATAQTPAEVRAAAPSLREGGTEMPVLSHERLFGLRRLFRVGSGREGERFLFSQLVGFDSNGRKALTSICGELERLRFDDGTLIEATVWKLDRNDLTLHRVDSVQHVPSLGADRFLLRETAPVSILPSPRQLPCARCHDEGDFPMSLLNREIAIDERWSGLLDHVLVTERADP